jgi:hypothetical protein
LASAGADADEAVAVAGRAAAAHPDADVLETLVVGTLQERATIALAQGAPDAAARDLDAALAAARKIAAAKPSDSSVLSLIAQLTTSMAQLPGGKAHWSDAVAAWQAAAAKAPLSPDEKLVLAEVLRRAAEEVNANPAPAPATAR